MKLSHKKVGFILAGIIALMLGLSFAAVPLYKYICQVTGFGGTPRIVSESPDVDASDQTITIRFDASVDSRLPWAFYPENVSMTVPMDEPFVANYIARNESDHPIVGQAIYNLTPLKAAMYMAKIDCFCFTEQRLEAGEEKLMPINFYIDSSIYGDKSNAQEVKTLTLSYTFFHKEDVEDQGMDKMIHGN